MHSEHISRRAKLNIQFIKRSLSRTKTLRWLLQIAKLNKAAYWFCVLE